MNLENICFPDNFELLNYTENSIEIGCCQMTGNERKQVKLFSITVY